MSGPVLFVDTETTGLVDWKAPLTAEHQPRVAAVGLILATRERRLAAFTALVRPDGAWTMPPAAAAVNGLSTELCQEFGLKFEYAWHVLVTLAHRAERICCHNVAFDKAMLDIEVGRLSGIATMPERTWFCTKEQATGVCKLPKPSGGSGYKLPTLDEAHRHLCGVPVEGAHNALVDAEACARVYWKLVGLE